MSAFVWLSYSIAVPLLVGLIFYRSIPSYAKLLVIQLLVGFLIEPLAQWYAYKFGNNMVLFYGYLVALYILNLLIFYSLINNKKIFWFGLGGLSVVAEFFVFGPDRFPSFSFLFLDLFIVLGCLFVLVQVVSGKVEASAMWIIITMFYYFISATIYLTMHSAVDPHALITLSKTWAISNLISNLCYTASLWKPRYSS